MTTTVSDGQGGGCKHAGLYQSTVLVPPPLECRRCPEAEDGTHQSHHNTAGELQVRSRRGPLTVLQRHAKTLPTNVPQTCLLNCQVGKHASFLWFIVRCSTFYKVSKCNKKHSAELILVIISLVRIFGAFFCRKTFCMLCSATSHCVVHEL